MKAEDIRAYELQTRVGVPAPLEDIAFMLREIAAQLAEMNERHARKAKAESEFAEQRSRRKQPKEMSSVARRDGKLFYHHGWSMTATEDMLNVFTPNEGQKWPSELEKGEHSIGTCGVHKDVKITRTK